MRYTEKRLPTALHTRSGRIRTGCLITISILFGLTGCSDNNSKAKPGSDSTVVTAKAQTPVQNNNDPLVGKEYDVYKYEDDSLIQLAYIHYLSPHKISFTLKSGNKKNGKSCSLSDTAVMEMTNGDDPDPASYEDELAENELYPAFEFVYKRDSRETTIGIEPSRGKRLAITTALRDICDRSCPLGSAGTLRRTSLSSVKQEGPHLPPRPGKK